MSAGADGRRGRLVPGMIALGALLAIGIVWGAGADLTHPGPHTLSGRDVGSQVALGIQAERGLSEPPQVNCPAAEPVRSGLVFECSVSGLSSKPEKVDVTEIDTRGHLRWKVGSP